MSKGIPCSVSCASRVAVQFGAFDGSLFYLVHVKGRWFCLSGACPGLLVLCGAYHGSLVLCLSEVAVSVRWMCVKCSRFCLVLCK
jgi:hypothetical protein